MGERLCIDCHKEPPVHRYAARCARCREQRMDYCDLVTGRVCGTLAHVAGKSDKGIVIHRDKHRCGCTHVYVGCNGWGLNYCPWCREPMDDGWDRSHPMFGGACCGRGIPRMDPRRAALAEPQRDGRG